MKMLNGKRYQKFLLREEIVLGERVDHHQFSEMKNHQDD